jgi:hypothetical protein
MVNEDHSNIYIMMDNPKMRTLDSEGEAREHQKSIRTIIQQ